MNATKNPTTTTNVISPEQRKISAIQAGRLAGLTNVPAKELEGKTFAQLSDQFKGIIDPNLFLFREICGTVVQPNPATGTNCPVPNATVTVEDTVCNLVSYIPSGFPWMWYFPALCRREVIATTTTDPCGNFCVLVPRFEIEWILRWRAERVCFPIIFNRPTVGDLLNQAAKPAGGSASNPLDLLTDLPSSTLEAIAGSAAGKLAKKVAKLKRTQTFGSPNRLTKSLLNARAFEQEMPPPLPGEFRQALAGGENVIAAKGASARDGIRSAVALKLGLNPAAKEIAGFDPDIFVGPFFRCYELIIPEWQLILENPDLSFQVTQNTNNGTQTIYTGSSFDIPWSTGDLTGVTLLANANAIANCNCATLPPVGPCTNPTIVDAGMMNLSNNTADEFFNGSFIPAAGTFTLPTQTFGGSLSALPVPTLDPNVGLGYAVGPNMAVQTSPAGPVPSASSFPTTGLLAAPDGCPLPVDASLRKPSGAPFYGTFLLSGCADWSTAQYYRIMQSTDNGQTFLPLIVPAFPNTATPPTANNVNFLVTSDINGWYPVNPIYDSMGDICPRANLQQPDLLLQWPTAASPDGLRILYIQLADANKKLFVPSSPPAMVAFEIDNTRPQVTFNSIMWKISGQPDSTLQPVSIYDCPLIPTQGQAIEIVVKVSVLAGHLRNACLYAAGCGGTTLDIMNDPNNYSSYWYALGGTPSGDSIPLYQRYYLPANATAGCYTFGCYAASRAMNPSSDLSGDSVSPEWVFDPSDIYFNPTIAVAIIGG